MPITRHFLGWDKPCLRLVAAKLLNEAASLDLQKFTLVLPGARAGRRLLEILVEEAEKRDGALSPPRIITLGTLPELILPKAGSVASKQQTLLAWYKALITSAPGELAGILPHLPGREDLRAWLGLAKKVESLYLELGAASLSFKDAAQKCQSLGIYFEEERWNTLAALENKYHQALSQKALTDWQSACFAGLKEKSVEFEGELWLVAAADLNNLSKRLLESLSCEIKALVAAPKDQADNFDQFGALIVEKWSKQNLHIDSALLKIADSPQALAQDISSFLARQDPKFSCPEISIGVTDQKLTPFIMQELSRCGLKSRQAVGKELSASGPLGLLAVVSRYLENYSFENFAALIRHVDMQVYLETWLESNGQGVLSAEFLSCVDRYQNEFLQASINPSPWGNGEKSEALRLIKRSLDELLGDFSPGKETLTAWAGHISNLLLKMYGDKTARVYAAKDREYIESLDLIKEALLDLRENDDLELTAPQTLNLLGELLAGTRLSPEALEGLEILGWLELSLDDAPVLAVAGLNEGFVPESINADPFLPNMLREKLGLVDNQRRLARDLYALKTILESKEHLLLSALRRDSAGEALLLSRLLLQDKEAEVAKRILAFYQTQEEGHAEAFCDKGALPLLDLKPRQVKAPAVVSVSAFSDYLKCPFRFYLKHVLKLKRTLDRAVELDAPSFGSFAHQVLNRFTLGPNKDCQDADAICECLMSELAALSWSRFGKNALPAVPLQIEQLKLRLRAFSQAQAAWAAAGWRIKASELALKADASLFGFSPEVLTLEGRIDRLDYNTQTGQWAVLDYKLRDSQESVEKTHRTPKSGEWISLQLPLYELLCAGKYKPLQLGFIVIDANAEVRFDLASWDDETLLQAKTLACQTAGDIVKGKFWPPKDLKYGYDEFAELFIGASFGQEADENL